MKTSWSESCFIITYIPGCSSFNILKALRINLSCLLRSIISILDKGTQLHMILFMSIKYVNSFDASIFSREYKMSITQERS